jgi:hypothetical protein
MIVVLVVAGVNCCRGYRHGYGDGFVGRAPVGARVSQLSGIPESFPRSHREQSMLFYG